MSSAQNMASYQVKPTPFNPQIGNTLVNWDGRQATVISSSREKKISWNRGPGNDRKKKIWFKHNVAKVIPGGAVSVNDEFLSDLNTEMSPTPTPSPATNQISVPKDRLWKFKRSMLTNSTRNIRKKNTKKKTSSDVNILLEYIKQTEPSYKDTARTNLGWWFEWYSFLIFHSNQEVRWMWLWTFNHWTKVCFNNKVNYC